MTIHTRFTDIRWQLRHRKSPSALDLRTYDGNFGTVNHSVRVVVWLSGLLSDEECDIKVFIWRFFIFVLANGNNQDRCAIMLRRNHDARDRP